MSRFLVPLAVFLGVLAADAASQDTLATGGTVQFAPGTYLIDEIISVTVPRITLPGSAGSDGNENVGNTFEDIAGDASSSRATAIREEQP
jgi:hypothetical protein